MKDLYTFDYSVSEALKTYEAVKIAYKELFDELKIPYLVAAADSGNMGGSLSHEYHFISPKGEDQVVSCSRCDLVYNEELADGKTHRFFEPGLSASPGFNTGDSAFEGGPTISTGMWMAISHDSNTIVRAWYPKFSMKNDATEPVERHINSHAVKAIATAAGIDLDLSVEKPLARWTKHVKSNKSSTQKPRVLDLYDSHVRPYQRPPLSDLLQEVGCTASDIEYSKLDEFPETCNELSLVRVHDGDDCSQCLTGSLTSHSAVELGHTFYLGTRYSEVLNASVSVKSELLESTFGFRPPKPSKESQEERIVPMQMGCHGIGVSRMISAVANRLADSKGLNWPRAIAPYEVVVVPGKGLENVADQVYDNLIADGASLDVILDDRDKGMGWKLGDADMIGYPIIVVVGNGWKKKQTLEVQCRRLGIKEDVSLGGLRTFVQSLLAQL